MRNIDEIKERIKKHVDDQPLMIAITGMIHPLSIWVPEYFKEGYESKAFPLTEESVIGQMRDYMDFAFGKAYGCRGISASRSIWNYVQWLWLLEDYELLAFAQDDSNYAMYGVPILRKIAMKYGFEDPNPNYEWKGKDDYGYWIPTEKEVSR